MGTLATSTRTLALTALLVGSILLAPTESLASSRVFDIAPAIGQSVPALAMTEQKAYWVGELSGVFGVNKTDTVSGLTTQIYTFPATLASRTAIKLKAGGSRVAVEYEASAPGGDQTIVTTFDENGAGAADYSPSTVGCATTLTLLSLAWIAIRNDESTAACAPTTGQTELRWIEDLSHVVNPGIRTPIFLHGIGSGPSPVVGDAWGGGFQNVFSIWFTASRTDIAGRYPSVISARVDTAALGVLAKGNKDNSFSLSATWAGGVLVKRTNRTAGTSMLFYPAPPKRQKFVELMNSGTPLRDATNCKSKIVGVTVKRRLISTSDRSRLKYVLNARNESVIRFSCDALGSRSRPSGDGIVHERRGSRLVTRIFRVH